MVEKVMEIQMDKLVGFRNHPFQVKDDESLNALCESVRDYGMLSPLLARPTTDGNYEIVSGHRRKAAAMKLGLEKLPVLVREMTDDEAVILMVDSNIQRENLLPSEKAYAYKMKLEALRHQGTRTDLTCGQVGHKSRDDVSDTESGRTVQRYIRLTNLIPELLEFMDKGKMALSVGVELSYLDDQLQYDVLEQCEQNDCTPSYSQAVEMKKRFHDRQLSAYDIGEIMAREKPNQRETIKIPAEKLLKFAPNTDPKQLEDFVLKACEHYRRYLIRQRERDR